MKRKRHGGEKDFIKTAPRPEASVANVGLVQSGEYYFFQTHEPTNITLFVYSVNK